MACATARSLMLLGLVFALLTPAHAASAAGGGGGGVQSDGADDARGQERIGAGHYRAGLRARDAAWRFEEKGREADDRETAKRFYRKARKQYEKAIQSQRKAVKNAPDMYQAHGSLGYALRKIGRYDEALASYDRALELEPRYGEAVEYRAEAYLQLGRLQDVQRAWVRLQKVPELADQLMEAIDHWLARQERVGSKIEAAVLEAFATWVREQKSAGHTASPPTAAAGQERW